MTTNQMVDTFRRARRTSTPIVLIVSPDPAATIPMLMEKDVIVSQRAPCVRWDCVRGLQGLNDSGNAALGPPINVALSAGFAPATIEMQKLPDQSLVFALNTHLQLQNPNAIQGVWNMRDEFKRNMRMLVMVNPDVWLPPELRNDVVVIQEPLPGPDQLAAIVHAAYKASVVNLGEPSPEVLTRAQDALIGLPAYPAEQVTVMSLTRNGLDLDSLWDRKRQAIDQTPGLKVYRGGETFADVAGLEQIKAFTSRVVEGRRCIVWIDEIEKQIAGITGDLSGISQDQLSQVLQFMDSEEADGLIAAGPPGTGKSLLARALGAEARIPTIKLDFGDMKDSLVGGSEARLRAALRVITAVGQGRPLFVATSNGLGIMPPELRRRFNLQAWMFDLPTEAERLAVWRIYEKKYDVKGKRPQDEQWTSDEIRRCCYLAQRLKSTLVEASRFIVPYAQNSPERLAAIRNEAHGRYLSASLEGVYRMPAAKSDKVIPNAGRTITLAPMGEA